MLKQTFNKAWHKWSIFRQHSFAKTIFPFFEEKQGIEIGGPSSIFLFELPLYTRVKSLDGCNFSNHTVWEGTLKQGNNYKYYKNKTGYQFIAEGSNLNGIVSEQYDFLLASHCLEHLANPLKALKEWLRVIKIGGAILLVLPKKEIIFDHNRSVTTFEHILDDYLKGTDEADLTHLNEILELHDLSMDAGAGDIDNFKRRSAENFKYRCLHHHVFDFALLNKMFAHFNVTVYTQKLIPECHQVIVGIKN